MSYAQEIPPIQIFTPNDYGADDQNWSITQSQNDFIYVANNKGLLEYNGASWQLYNSPNEGILRTVKLVNGVIFSGGYMDFGFWIKNKKGKLSYTSLSDHKDLSIKEDEDFWGIVSVEDFVLFQSFDRIYIYNTTEDSFSIIDSDTRINKMFKVKESVYFQKIGVGVFKIENGEASLVIPSNDIDNTELVNIFNSDSGLLFQTKEKGFYKFKDQKVEHWNISSDSLLADISIYCSVKLKDGGFILGTIANGIIHLDENGDELMKIDQSYGLSNNTALSMFEDSYGNVWLGLDNGINILNLNSPFKVYTDKLGVLGTVYAAAQTDDFLYLGTNQGLFYKPKGSNVKFNFIKGTKGQVWFLSVLKQTLFCGHNKGTFVIEGGKAKQVSSEMGTWIVKEIEGYPNLLIQGNYIGMNILEYVNNTWQYRNKVEGFTVSSRYFEFINPHELLVSHEHKGVYNVKMDNDFRSVSEYSKLPIGYGVGSSIISYNNTILYSYKEGVFSYDLNNKNFVNDTILSNLFSEEQYISGKLFNETPRNKLWGFSKDKIIYIEPGKLSSEPEIKVIAISSELRKSKSAFENILDLGDDKYLIGTTEGYLIIDLKKLVQQDFDMHLNSVEFGKLPNELLPLDLVASPTLKNKSNNVRFTYSVTNYNKLSASKYQYKLSGIYNEWSDWSGSSEVFFKNLPHGDYNFEARAMTDGVVLDNDLSYDFSIEKPWYLKPLAIISYILMALLFIYVLFYFNKKHYKKQQQKLIKKKERQLKFEQLENQRQLIQFKNKNLQLNIENKNRELGMATMNLVKRNELLNSIKSELSKSKTLNEVKKVIKVINSNLNNTNDWELFEEAFNNVDKDFMKKMKSIHPTITPNDLRLCAYLRLNLSSKEIAPLLNISHKSVEVKRYRLRKKLELDHEQSLSNYIIEI
ncbi:helix-turn-helix and ligand-binding sensor domain-containing protein [Winogradskyella costae]|uniref:helix-turn-helix and ligand-binding sensor domain-containing protein n=1 Tax=Winogradskyella costae TaxID=2697008 RepID=UPI001FE31942|nr:triple tyrosine motif-containing protein [Winogradskyella costae]